MYIPNNCFLNINNDRLKRNIINISINNKISNESEENIFSNEHIRYSFKVKNDITNKTVTSNINHKYGNLYFWYQFEESVTDSFLIFLNINNENNIRMQR